MKALSIRQPWAHAILYCGKDIENRDWKPGSFGLRYRGPFLIHAAKSMRHEEFEEGSDTIFGIAFKKIDRADLQFGGIIGAAEIAGTVRRSDSPWFTGPQGLVIRNPRVLPFVPYTGQLGFFDVPDALLRERGIA
jgi:hypothetical protein